MMNKATAVSVVKVSTGALASRRVHYVFALAIVTWTLDLITCLVLLPDAIDHTEWPTYQQSPAYTESILLWSTVVTLSAQTLCVLILCTWVYRYEHVFSPTCSRIWNAMGVTAHSVPWGADLVQATSLVASLFLLTFPRAELLAVTLAKCVVQTLFLGRRLFPLWQWRQGERDCLQYVQVQPSGVHRIDRKNFWHYAQLIGSVAFWVAVVLFVAFALQYQETFATAPQLYSTAQLRFMRVPPNDTFAAKWAADTQRALGTRALGIEKRVVLVVVDGLRHDQVERNADLARILREPQRAADMHVGQLKVGIPTMSVPNWLAMLTGALAEVHGLHGNVFSRETEYDSVFSRLAQADTYSALKGSEYMRGLSAHPFFAALVRTHLPRLQGDGTSPDASSYEMVKRNQPLGDLVDLHLSSAEMTMAPWYMMGQAGAPDGDNDIDTDYWRLQTALQAINETTDPYRLFLLHFSNVDTQGHARGCPPDEAASAYGHAVSNVARFLRKLLDASDAHPTLADKTVVIITSDHGHVLAGGHGGAYADELLRVPFVVYQRGGNLASVETVANMSVVDVAPCVAALLSVPVPRQASGIPPPVCTIGDREQTVWRDLFEAKQARLNSFLVDSRYTSAQWRQFARRTPALVAEPDTATTTADEYRQLVRDLEALYEQRRSFWLGFAQARNIVLSALLAACLLMFVMIRVERYTLASFLWLDEPIPPRITAEYVAMHASAKRMAHVLVVLYLLLEWGILRAVYWAVWRYDTWDMTVLHDPAAIKRFALLALALGTLLQFLLVRFAQCSSVRWLRALELQPSDKLTCTAVATAVHTDWWRWFFIETTVAHNRSTSRGAFLYIYLLRVHTFVDAVRIWCVLITLQGVYSFVLAPFVFTNWVITPATWTWRFWVASTGFMCLPLLFASVYQLRSTSYANRKSVPRDHHAPFPV